uniref:Uncharacterized protein n=1 Tax=Chenopodium quinoa TaxID=63459 RepID=A0A803M2F6_CHEQI
MKSGAIAPRRADVFRCGNGQGNSGRKSRKPSSRGPKPSDVYIADGDTRYILLADEHAHHSDVWVLDSGASYHISSCKECFTNNKHVPQVTRNLISLSILNRKGFSFKSEGGGLYVYKGSKVVLKGVKPETLYVLQGSTLSGSEHGWEDKVAFALSVGEVDISESSKRGIACISKPSVRIWFRRVSLKVAWTYKLFKAGLIWCPMGQVCSTGQLAEAGAHVVMAVRNPKAAHELIQKWQIDWSGKGLPLNIEVMELDLLSLDSVAQFAEAWNARSGPLHVLINNAGIFSIGEPQKFSKDGNEEHMQVNHLAPAMLSVLLLPSLIRGSPSRIINVNSVMHSIGFVDPEDLNVVTGKRKFTSLVGYSSSKLAQIMFSSIFQKRLPAESGINVVCVSPGIVHTNVARDLSKVVQAAYHLIPYFIFSPEEESVLAGISLSSPGSCYEIVIRNCVVKQAAWAYYLLIHTYSGYEIVINTILSFVKQAAYFLLFRPLFPLPPTASGSFPAIFSYLFSLFRQVIADTVTLIHGSRSTLFAATDPQIPEYCELLKADEWPTCAFISQDCRPSNPSEEAHNIGTSTRVWEKSLEMIGLPSDAVEKLIEGEEVTCRYGRQQE